MDNARDRERGKGMRVGPVSLRTDRALFDVNLSRAHPVNGSHLLQIRDAVSVASLTVHTGDGRGTRRGTSKLSTSHTYTHREMYLTDTYRYAYKQARIN